MKKALTAGITLVTVLFCIPLISHAERIKNFSINIKVQENSEVLVTEQVTYDFEGLSRHGIYRDIPIHNSDGSWLVVKNITVTDEDGINYPMAIMNDTRGAHIKIGDPKELITGIKQYSISYTVENALVSFTSYDELYWNGIGNGWKVPIDKASLSINIPGGIDNIVQVSCYRGEAGMISKCAPGFTTGHPSLLETDIMPNFGVTIAIGIKKSVIDGISRIGGQSNIEKNPFSDDTVPSTSPLAKAGIIGVGLLFIVISVGYWLRYRDPKSKNPVVAWYEPPFNLPPITLGTLLDKQTDSQDITAQILSLANRGYLSLERIDSNRILVMHSVDYSFTLTKDPSHTISDLDKNVMEILFGPSHKIGTQVLMSDLSRNTTDTQVLMEKTKSTVMYYLISNGYMEKANRINFMPILLIIFAIAFYIIISNILVVGNFIVILVPVFFICALVLISFKRRLTLLGVDTQQQVKGFKLFLSVTDKERFTFHNAPEKNPQQFMEYLPYAIALGVEKKWAKQFEGITLAQPSWYQSNTANSFIAASFVSDLSSLNNSFTSAASSASSRSGSGGGGFSGGGGGGGGGGSW